MRVRYQVYWDGYRSETYKTDPFSFIEQIKLLRKRIVNICH